MARVVLTDRFIRSLLTRPPPARVTAHRDALVPGLSVRVQPTGHVSFALTARFPANARPAGADRSRVRNNPTRRGLGEYGTITLEQARDQAREWITLIRRGVDPKVVAATERAEQTRRGANTFAYVAEEFLSRHAARRAKAEEMRRVIETEFVKRWGPRPITDVRPEECAAAVHDIVRRARRPQGPKSRGEGTGAHARNALGYLRGMFNWAIGTNEFGVERSPVERLRPGALIGAMATRSRILTTEELRQLWGATATIGYPVGDVARMLLLTGQRLHEVADMRWEEVDLDAALWTIPAERMKNRAAQEVPLAPMALDLLRSMPRLVGPFVFSADGGRRHYAGFSRAKRRLDRLSGVEGWQFHDLRRTMRTMLSALPIEDRVREAMIAHAPPSLHKVYDRHSYQEEKRRGFELYERRLAGILEPTPAGVESIERARARRSVGG